MAPPVSQGDMKDLFPLPPNIEVRVEDISGRGIYAAEDMTQGSVIFELFPLIQVLQASEANLDQFRVKDLSNSCINCYSDIDSSTRILCQLCHAASYCCEACKESDNMLHTAECDIFTRYQERFAQAHPSILSIIVIRTKGAMLQSAHFEAQVQSMESHSNMIENNLQIKNQTQEVIEELSSVVDWDPEEIRMLCHIMFINSTFLFDDFGELIGQLFDPTLALFNHSCDPNVDIYCEANKTELVSNKEVKKGEQLFINYCMKDLPSALRRFDLKNRFCFECSCTKCESDKAFDPHQDHRCRKCGNVCWNYSILDFVDGKEIVNRGKECCKSDFKFAKSLQSFFFKTYAQLVFDVLPAAAEQATLSAEALVEAANCEILHISASRYKELRKYILIATTGPGANDNAMKYPLNQLLTMMENCEYCRGLDSVFYGYLINFKTSGRLYSKVYMMYDHLVELVEACESRTFQLLDEPELEKISLLAIFMISVSCYNQVKSYMTPKSDLSKRAAILMHNAFVKVLLNPNSRTDIVQWFKGRCKFQTANRMMQDFELKLSLRDRRFILYDLRPYHFQSGEEFVHSFHRGMKHACILLE